MQVCLLVLPREGLLLEVWIVDEHAGDEAADSAAAALPWSLRRCLPLGWLAVSLSALADGCCV